jgi:hypothetical protein
MSRHNQSHDQKRKAKLAKRAARRPVVDLTPYAGKKYQQDRWVPHVYQTELAVYETIHASGHLLTNDHVKAAFVQLIKHLGSGQPALLAEGDPDVLYAPGREVEYLIWNIRRHWGLLFAERGPVRDQDLIGILRTLLHSIKAQAWHSGPDRGYVHFLEHFIQRTL